jgi:hypothetical protein
LSSGLKVGLAIRVVMVVGSPLVLVDVEKKVMNGGA